MTVPAPWDLGITWRTIVSDADGGSPDFLAVDATFVREKVLRVFTDTDESTLIEHYIRAATAFGERLRGEHIAPKTLTLVASGFPAGEFELVDAPVRSITSIEYIDTDGATQTYGGSPVSYVFTSGGRFGRSRIRLGDGESWPATMTRADAVTVTFEVGYIEEDDVPYDIRQAILVTVGEFYKNPDLSNSDGQAANALTLAHFWPRRWSNGV